MPLDEERYVEYAVADWLRQKRHSLGFRQKDIGEALDVSRVAVSLWETGAQAPGTLSRWKAWARAVNCRLEITMVDTNGERHSF